MKKRYVILDRDGTIIEERHYLSDPDAVQLLPLAAEDVRLDGIYFCPHKLDDNCCCRKPEPGLVDLAARQLDFNPAACVVIGDKRCDIELGRRIGAMTMLVRTGYGAQEEATCAVAPDHFVDNLHDAAKSISTWMK